MNSALRRSHRFFERFQFLTCLFALLLVQELWMPSRNEVATDARNFAQCYLGVVLGKKARIVCQPLPLHEWRPDSLIRLQLGHP